MRLTTCWNLFQGSPILGSFRDYIHCICVGMGIIQESPRHYTVDSMLFPSGNPFKCHEEVLYLQPLIPPKRFDIFSPLTGGCSEGPGAF